MKMSNKKFVAMATAVGLTVGLLSGCGTPVKTVKEKDDDNDVHGGGLVPYPYMIGSSTDKSISSSSRNAPNPSSSISSSSSTEKSSEVVNGSKGIGSAKGGGAGS